MCFYENDKHDSDSDQDIFILKPFIELSLNLTDFMPIKS